MDYFLKANTEQELMTTLVNVGAVKTYEVKNEDGETIEVKYIATSDYSLDIIGTIYKPTGNVIQQVVNDNTYEVPETVALEGFHANLRGPVDLAPKVEYIPYIPTEQELMDPSFVMPEPEVITTPSPIESLLVQPKNPVRVWA